MYVCIQGIKSPVLNGPRRDKTCLRRFANNKGADQPTHQRSLISAFIIRILESIISKLASRKKITILAILCDWGDWFESSFYGSPEDRFSRVSAQINPDKIALQIVWCRCA